MKKDTKRFIAYMLMNKHWRIEYNGVLLQPDDIEFLKLIAKKSGQKFDRLDKTVNPN
jgi:hypothetical protein